MTARDLTALVHLAGFATGIILYAMLGVMTRRRLSYVTAAGDQPHDSRVPLVASVLGVVWNVGAMFVFAVRDFDIAYQETWIAAIAYTALGFLPAVVVHSTLGRAQSRLERSLLGVAYTGSAIAGVLHFFDAAHGETPSSAGLLLLTITYGAVLGALALMQRRRLGSQRGITAVALAAFAVSALHLSRHALGADQASWPVELIGHHASLPLVLAILYKDYRFAFADLFLKRAVSLLLLVALVSLLYATIAAPFVDPHLLAARQAIGDGSHLFSTGVLLALWIATALCYPVIQRRVFQFVDRVVLRRADYRSVRSDLAQRLTGARDGHEALDLTCELLGRALGASRVSWRVADRSVRAPHSTITLDAHRAEAQISVPTAIEPSYEIQLAALTGGRALLSGDLMLIDAVAASVGRRIDEIRVEAERAAHQQREQEVLRLATEAELRALRAQLNPHFLFNALNTLGHLMQSAPDRAVATLYQLTGLLRAVLRKSNGQFVELREELDIVESYLAIEHERFQERLVVLIDVPFDVRSARIPPLVLQPLVENAVKHGIAPMREGGSVTVRARRDALPGESGGFLRLTVIDTGAGTGTANATRDGVGLSNINQRLDHYFGVAAAMSIHPTPGGGTTVELVVPLIASDRLAS